MELTFYSLEFFYDFLFYFTVVCMLIDIVKKREFATIITLF